MKKSKDDLVKNWLKKAERDLKTAQKLLDSGESFNDIVCFHSQQAGEKYLKVFLIWSEIQFPKTHSLEDLILLASKADSSFLMFKSDWIILTPYATEFRYGESDDPSLEDTKEAYEKALQIKNFVMNKIPAL